MSNNASSCCRDEIRELMARYADAIHRVDGEDWAQCWHPDAHWIISSLDSPPNQEELTGQQSIKQFWLTAMEHFKFVEHKVSSHSISPQMEQNRASGRCYVNESFEYLGNRFDLFGVYNDVYIKGENGWLFLTRKFNLLRVDEAGKPTVRYCHPNRTENPYHA
ncbi:nuclear transport factor 2 family protein [Shewanella corallii]|uniref:Nuclear transport factor 2 family protein n=1 Tax=Shewanella corallii TaxID=560080 RepID=A0ABT0NAP0_9GAMM|nr:nuclear transport factor 2 family protein [Shewanella corallii]MCL2915483.1 nuclear transport factor 2 family protein [Shewanella corallii]